MSLSNRRNVQSDPKWLRYLADVSVPSPSGGQALAYDAALGKWTAQSLVTGVSSVSNVDGTLAISPDTGAVIASLNLGKANTWLQTQTFPASSLTNAELAGPVVTSLITETAAGITLTASGSGVGAYAYTPAVTFGGDLSGSSLGAATVSKLQTYALTLGSPSVDQVLVWNGSAYVNAAVPATAGVTSLGAQTGAITLSTGLSMAVSVLTAQWQAGLVTSLSSGLSISSGVLTVTFPAQQWQAGTVTSLGSGLSISTDVLTLSGIANASLAGPLATGLTTEAAAGITLTAFGSGVGAYAYTPSVALGGDLSGTSLSAATLAKLQGVPVVITALATNDLLQYNGTDYVNVLPSSLGLVNSVSNSDGTLTISPTTGSVVASLALGHANTWTGAQTINSLILGGTMDANAQLIENTGNITPNTDATYTLGTASLRYENMNVSKDFSVWLNSGDTQPQIQLDSASVALIIGGGGSTAPDVAYARNGAKQASIFTYSSTAFTERIRIQGNAPVGLAGILTFEPIQFSGNSAQGTPAGTFIGQDASDDLVFSTSSVASTAFRFFSNSNEILDIYPDAISINKPGVTNFTLTAGSPSIINTNGGVALVFQSGGTEAFRVTSTPTIQFSVPILTTNTITQYNAINTTFGGVPAEYASTGTTPVALGTASTVIDTYTPVANGQFLVVVEVVGKVSTTLSSLTVTYTDITTGVTTTQTLATTVAIGLDAAVTYSALCPATTASAISVQGTALTASDLYASASFLAL